jgi:hypothetical protein
MIRKKLSQTGPAYLLLFSLFFPNFIAGFPIGQIFALYTLVLISIVYLFAYKIRINTPPNFILFTMLFLLLLVSAFAQEVSLRELQTIARPIGLFFICALFYHIFLNLKSISRIFQYFERTIIVILMASILFFIAENYILSITDYIYILYVREHKDFHGSVSFFWMPYAAAFVFYTTFLYGLSSFLIVKLSKINALILTLSFILILASQSGGILLATIITTTLVILFNLFLNLSHGIISKKWILFFLIFIFGFLLFWIFIDGLRSSNYAFRVLFRLVNEFNSTGTFQVRIEQIEMAFQESIAKFGFGGGLARGTDQRHLESWVAAVTHRYGLLGLFIYTTWFFLLAYKLKRELIKSNADEAKVVYLFGLIWVCSLPLSMISGFQIETGKTAIFSWFVIAFLFSFLRVQSVTRCISHN